MCAREIGYNILSVIARYKGKSCLYRMLTQDSIVQRWISATVSKHAILPALHTVVAVTLPHTVVAVTLPHTVVAVTLPNPAYRSSSYLLSCLFRWLIPDIRP